MSLSERTPIQKFYKNLSIFVTGASGFIGTALLEKLIRSCSDIKTIYILMREKKNTTVEQRLDEIFDNHIWDTVSKQNPNYKSYVKIINGELMSPKLGISDEDYAKLQNEVNVIFHVAATVRFDEPLKRAAKINIEATKNILELGKVCKNIKAVIHVSTAYSQCTQLTLKEVYYTPQRDPEEFLRYCEETSEEELDIKLSSILGKYPNTYSFTKSLAENVVKKFEKELPVAICRPSIVNGCYQKPVEAWFKSIFGPVGVMIGIGLGVLHVMPMKLDAIVDLVPVDMCVNQMLAVAYETAKKEKTPAIYNFVTGSDNPITWREYMHWNLSFGHGYVSSQSIWHYFVVFAENKKLIKFYQFFLHIIPALIVDTYLKLSGKRPKLIKIYRKIHKMTNMLYPFLTTPFQFYSDNTRQLYESLDLKDQEIFPFDVRSIVWDIYLHRMLKYTRIYIVKDPLTNVLETQKKMFRFKMAHFTLIFVFLWLIVYFFLFYVSKLFV